MSDKTTEWTGMIRAPRVERLLFVATVICFIDFDDCITKIQDISCGFFTSIFRVYDEIQAKSIGRHTAHFLCSCEDTSLSIRQLGL